MNVGNYLFGFNGRINRAKWWLLVLIYIIYVVIVSYFIVRSMGISFPVYVAIQVPLWYVTLAVTIKRLHDRDKGAIWAALFVGVPIVIGCYNSYLTWGAIDAARAMAQATTPEEMQAAAAAVQAAQQNAIMGAGPVYWILIAISVAIAVWQIVELGCLRGTVGDNQYGSDPMAGKPA